MNKRKFRTSPEELLELGRAIVKSSQDTKFIYRVTLVNLVVSGIPVATLSIASGESINTITLWVKTADEQGFDALKGKPRIGRKSRLTDAQKASIKEAVSKDPLLYGYQLWEGKSVSDFIRKTFSIQLGVRQCQRLLRELGFSLIRPQVLPGKGEENEAEREEFKKIQNLMSDENNVIVFQDEVHFQKSTSITRMWAPKGSAPTVKSPPGKESIAYSGYVIPETGELIMDKPGWFNFETVIASVRNLIEKINLPADKRICLVLDNAPWHKKAFRLIQTERQPEYQDIRDRVTFIPLPPYSPDMNPIEQCWRITRKKVTHNRYFKTLPDLVETLDAFFEAHRVPNQEFKTLCSFHWLKAA